MDFNFNNKNDPWEFCLDIDDSDLYLTLVLCSSSSTRVEPSPLTLNLVRIIPGPAGIVQLSSSTRVEPSPSTPNPVRIILGPAGIVQQAKLLKEKVFILDSDGALMSTQEYMQKVVEDDDFNNKLQRWGNTAVNRCCLYLNDSKDLQHLFFHCSFSTDVWNRVQFWEILRYICMTGRVLYKERNNRIFKDSMKSSVEVFKGIMEVIKYKLLGITMKDSKAVTDVEDKWKISCMLLRVLEYLLCLYRFVDMSRKHYNYVGLEKDIIRAGGRLRKQRSDEAWATIERLAQYEDEGWNDALIRDEDAISLMGKSESVFRLTANEMYRPPSESSRQEEFEHIVMNFIFDQEERITQLEDYMQVIAEEFMEFSSEVMRRLKERIKENENKPRKIEKITKYPDTKVLENSAKHDFLEKLKKKTFPTPANLLCVRYVRLIHSNPSQPWKNIFGFKPGERANLSRHNPSNSLSVQPPTQNDTTFMVNDPIKRDPSPYCSFTHVEINRMFDPRRKTHDLSFKGSHGLQF
ncbi:hypothetical protein Tco_0672615 [Tanacetum coccineum]